MKKADFVTRYRAEMADVHVSPQLKRSTLDALEGKEKPIMKKKLSAALVLMIAIFLFGAAALAAANHAGILDFAGRYADTYVPEDASNYVQTDVLSVENELVTVHLRELYYDGYIARMAVDVAPKDSSIMLLGEDMAPEDNWQNMTVRSGEWDENDQRTALDIYRENDYQSVYAVNCRMFSDGVADRTFDYLLSEDNVLTLYLQTTFENSKAERPITLDVYLTPYGQPFNDKVYQWPDDRIIIEMPLVLQQIEYDNETYICMDAQEFPSIGVRVDEIRLEVRPQDIHSEILFTIIDRDAYNALEDGLWFEFIDPESTAEKPFEQRLQGGMTGYGGIEITDGKDMATAVHFRQTESLGRNELHDTYTLRAYECWEKQRFETRTFQMRKVDDLP
ncbi:MAG: hypothetical protein IKK75_05430 [Clostridia bacterium]|nr:hypothetical protein [Clostridia bacterium]